MALVRWVGRAIGLDVHREFCVVAICEDGKVRSAGSGAEHTGGASAVGGQSVTQRPGGVGGDGQLLGGRADP
jgi:hypothetical protein